MSRRPTIGFISTWPIYQGTTIDRYAYSLIQGISSAAHRLNCNLLLGCGSSLTGNASEHRSYWPVPGPDVEFLPVGPWNTDGLIIVSDELTASQNQYIHDLMASGFPVIFTTPEGPGSLVNVDNALGIRKAFNHLYNHGHRQIAYLAGHFKHGGDSEERLQAYYAALQEHNLPLDERLVAFGEHRKTDGAVAMNQIMESGAPFSAVIASNDLSCLGAIETLTAVGLRIPQDVAVIGFDDILDARTLTPSLTTIRHPTFSIGFQAVLLLMEYIRGERAGTTRVVVPPQLIVRQSCGCRLGQMETQNGGSSLGVLIHEMAEASLSDARNSLLEDLVSQMDLIVGAFVESLKLGQSDPIMAEIGRVLRWTEERGEDAHVWQTALAVLLQKLNHLYSMVDNFDPAYAASLLDSVRVEINDKIQRQTTRFMLGRMDMMAQLGQLTAEMVAAMNIDQSAEILARLLPQVGIQNALVALYDNLGEEPTSQGEILFSAGLPAKLNGLRFDSRKFPVSGLYDRSKPLQLIILPLHIDDQSSGFVAFNAPNPEMCAAIVLNLEVALRTSRLYLDAVEGRRMAEEASRLKSRFLSMVSHELRTPLSLIVGLSEMSLREHKVEIRDIEQINTSAQHLARLIGDVLDLATSEAGQLRILKEPLDLAGVLDVSIKIGEQLARDKGLEWQVKLPSKGLHVLGDRTRLRQVMLNLLSNAVKFTSEGRVEASVYEEAGKAVIQVNDTGMGIPLSEQETIFNEFYRTGRSVESGVTGLGLGLAITRHLVEQHGGTISVRSPGDLHCGTTFEIRLPLLDASEVKADQMDDLMKKSSNVFLLANQDEEVGEIMAFLKQRGHTVTFCRRDVEDTWLEQVNTLSPFALILAEHLASSAGWTVASLLKRSSETENIPILAYSLDGERNQGELLELNYLYKPVKPEQIQRVLPQMDGPRGRTPLILVVDDDPGVLAMHCRMIEGTGRRTLAARNGREALDLLETNHPDLILLDLMMPVMDGFEMLDELRKRESRRDIPVIILTGRVLTDADLERCNNGVATILGKGLFTTEETLNHIDSALTRNNTLSGPTRQLVRRAMTFIHMHYSEPITREEIAEEVGISADYLTDCFRQELGITPITYIRRYRIRRACDLLKNTDTSITQIAMSVGFSESAHFSHAFLRETGVTPRAYRLQGRK